MEVAADDATLHRLDAGAAAVNRDDYSLGFLAGGLHALIGAFGSWFVDRVDDVHVGVFGQQVFS